MANLNSYRVAVSALIEARASRVYAILADYRRAHRDILPGDYFRDLRVLRGGVGAGTTFLLEMRMLGRTRFMRQTVTEPDPGRLLTETDDETGDSTTFRVESGGPFTRVTIATELKSRGGLRGRLERWITSAVLRRIYSKELKLLADHCFREDEVSAIPALVRPRSVVA